MNTEAIPFNNDAAKDKPNVYFLLFDAYPGQRSLTDSFQFNNEAFTGLLHDSGFVQLPTKSNYDITKYSMSSILNLNYVEGKYVVNKETQQDEQTRLFEIKNAALFSIFSQMGYTIKNNSLFDIGDSRALSLYSGLVLRNTLLLADKF